MRRWVRISSGVFATTLVAAGVIAYTSSIGGAATVYLSPTGTDSGTCTQGSPCLSLNYAYTQGACGAKVDIAAGSYTDQIIVADATKSACTSNTVFRGTGATTVVASVGLNKSTHHITLDGLDITGQLYAADNTGGPQADTITVQNTTVNAQVTWSGTNTVFQNNNLNCVSTGEDCMQLKPRNATAYHDITVQDNTLGGMVLIAGHQDCIQLFGWQNVIIRRNTFVGCISADLFAKTADGGTDENDTNLTVENNVFGQNTGTDPYNLQIVNSGGTVCTNAVFDYNVSFGKNVVLDCNSAAPTQTQAYGNILGTIVTGGCSLATYKYTFRLSSGGGGDCSDATNVLATQTAAQIFVNPTTDNTANFHLTAGSEAKTKGDPTRCPIDDRDKNARPNPAGSTCDAGPYEGS